MVQNILLLQALHFSLFSVILAKDSADFIIFVVIKVENRPMTFTLDLHKLPFKPDSKQIIFVAGEHNEKVSALVEEHLESICEHYQIRGYTFCYIPQMKRSLMTDGKLLYNAPYADASVADEDDISDDFILDYMVHSENKDKVTPALLYYDPVAIDGKGAEEQMFGILLSENSFEGEADLSNVLEDILTDIQERRECKERQNRPSVQFSKEPSDDRAGAFVKESLLDYYNRDHADEKFDVESTRLIREIQERVDKLQQRGIDFYLIERMVRKCEAKLSRLHITKDYRIFLTDYADMEIEMTPLPKAVFFLFLRHPEGIRLKDRHDYREELIDIYKRLRPSYGTESTIQSIDDVTNPLSNSINEKCSRIREAFLSKFEEHLAEHYFVTGRRGEPKSIKLPRNLVTVDDEVAEIMKD